MPLETMSAAIDRLAEAGYAGSFSATDDGALRCSSCGGQHESREVAIDEIVRFEGDSDPADEAAVFALRCAGCSAMGAYVVAYGPEMEPADVEVVKNLLDHRRTLD
jgi:hypothetical protein